MTLLFINFIDNANLLTQKKKHCNFVVICVLDNNYYQIMSIYTPYCNSWVMVYWVRTSKIFPYAIAAIPIAIGILICLIIYGRTRVPNFGSILWKLSLFVNFMPLGHLRRSLDCQLKFKKNVASIESTSRTQNDNQWGLLPCICNVLWWLNNLKEW